jgi:diguanylate cyclase
MSTPTPAMPVLDPTMTFDQAARAVIAFLNERWSWGFWSIGRVSDGHQTHMFMEDNVFGLESGTQVPLEATICMRMLAGEGPNVAPDVQSVPAYAAAPATGEFGIKAYAGMPITEADGGTFGVLCGLSTSPIDPDEQVDEPLLGLLASLLGMVLAADRAREALARTAQMAHMQANTDIMTGLYNRRAWDHLLTEEEVRHAKFGDPAAVVLVDLDQLKTINDTEGHAAGDAYITRAGHALRAGVGDEHPVARLGGDEFGILLRDTNEADAEALVDELYAALEVAGVAGSIGWAPYTVIKGFPGAIDAADEAMYAAKRERRALAV